MHYSIFSMSSQHPGHPRLSLGSDPRSFTGGAGCAALLTGSHNRSTLRDNGVAHAPAPFDHTAYLDTLVRYNHDFFRGSKRRSGGGQPSCVGIAAAHPDASNALRGERQRLGVGTAKPLAGIGTHEPRARRRPRYSRRPAAVTTAIDSSKDSSGLSTPESRRDRGRLGRRDGTEKVRV
jgi:hypothetical protein